MILIDNYDSFTYNIVQYLQELGIEPKIFENDKITIEELKQLKNKPKPPTIEELKKDKLFHGRRNRK